MCCAKRLKWLKQVSRHWLYRFSLLKTRFEEWKTVKPVSATLVLPFSLLVLAMFTLQNAVLRRKHGETSNENGKTTPENAFSGAVLYHFSPNRTAIMTEMTLIRTRFTVFTASKTVIRVRMRLISVNKLVYWPKSCSNYWLRWYIRAHSHMFFIGNNEKQAGQPLMRGHKRLSSWIHNV